MTPFERLLAIMMKPVIVFSYIGLIIISFIYLDRPIAYYFHDLDLQQRLPILNWITLLGFGWLYIVTLPLVALFFRYQYTNKKWEIRAWFLFVCVLFPTIICFVLKGMLGRSRPELLFSDHYYGFYGPSYHASWLSFPSGHTTTIMGFVFGLGVLFPRYCWAFILSGLMVASSRILLTQHYLSDVLVASYLALLEVGLFVGWLRRKNFRFN